MEHTASHAGSLKASSRMPPKLEAQVTARLARIEGQVRGLQRMAEERRPCVDVLTQIEAAREALRQVGQMVLRNHMEHCIPKAPGIDPQLYDELMHLINRFSR